MAEVCVSANTNWNQQEHKQEKGERATTFLWVVVGRSDLYHANYMVALDGGPVLQKPKRK